MTNSVLGVRNIQHTNGTDAMTIASDGSVTISNTPGQILEVLAGICDGQSITVKSGTYTMPNISSSQTLSTSYADIPGSQISYTPPAGTKQVIYEFIHQFAWSQDHAISHWKLFIDGTEVTKARKSISGRYPENQHNQTWVFPIGGTADSTTGRQATWTSAKTIKFQAREYGTSNGYDKLYTTTYWDGASSSPQFSIPMIRITAIS